MVHKELKERMRSKNRGREDQGIKEKRVPKSISVSSIKQRSVNFGSKKVTVNLVISALLLMALTKLGKKSTFQTIIKPRNASNSTKMDIALMVLDVSLSII